jgi:primosomal protein N'
MRGRTGTIPLPLMGRVPQGQVPTLKKRSIHIEDSKEPKLFMEKMIAQIAVPVPVEGPFDYLIPDDLRGQIFPGSRVLVSFAGKKCVGFVLGLATGSTVAELKTIIKALDTSPVFSEDFLKFSARFAVHFCCSRGEALELFLPAYLRKSRLWTAPEEGGRSGQIKPRAEGGRHPGTLIFDPGGNRRWEVLLPRIRQELAQGRGVVCLIPDGSFAHDVLPKLSALVPREQFVVIRKGTEKEEFARWDKVRNGTARLVVGCISAVFTPVRELGLMVILDEESHFYKHDQSPFYHAREAAFLRQESECFEVILVSSAPSLEAWHGAAGHKDCLQVLDEPLAPVRLLDLTNFKMRKETAISPGLARQMENTLGERKSVLLYVPAARGTAEVVREAQARFLGARVAAYDKISCGLPAACDILVATQAVFRHRTALRFGLGAVLDVDWEFHKNDYRAAHGAFALVQRIRQMTVSGVLLQTRNVHNEYLHFLAANDYEGFYRRETQQRRDMGLPPYNVLAALVVRSADSDLACTEAKRLYDVFNEKRPESIAVLEPQQDRSACVRGKFRYCVMVHGFDVREVSSFVKETLRSFRRKKDVVVTVNINP